MIDDRPSHYPSLLSFDTAPFLGWWLPSLRDFGFIALLGSKGMAALTGLVDRER
jgi:hypothetical protein